MLDVPAVQSLGGSTGAIGLGNGLQLNNGQLAVSAALQQSIGIRVTTIQGQSGDVVFTGGSGIAVNGTRISNTGLTQLAGGNGLLVTQSGGLATVTLPQLLGATNSPTFAAVQLNNALGLASGGTNTNGSAFISGGLFYFDGSSFATTIAPSTDGLCLLSGPSGPYFDSCAGASAGVTSLNGENGVLILDHATVDSGTGHIIIQDAGTAQKGIAQFDGTDFDVSGGTVTLNATITQAGNVFNGSGQLVQLDINGQSTDTGQCLMSTASGVAFDVCPVGGNIKSGTSQSAGKLVKFDSTTNEITDSIITESNTEVTVAGTLLADSLQGGGAEITNLDADNIATGTLSVARGGTGRVSFAANSILIGNGTAGLGALTPGADGDCLVIVSGAPAFTTCGGAGGVSSVNAFTGDLTIQGANGVTVTTAAGEITITGPTIGGGVSSVNGLSGDLTVADTTQSGGTITINTATATVKGIASFDDDNLVVSGGVVNTIQGIGTSATPTFGGLSLQSATAALSGVGANGTTTLQFATQSGNDTKTIIIPNRSGTVAVDATGPLSLSASGVLTCATCLTSGGGGGTAGVTSVNTLTGALTINGANGVTISQSGTTITVTGPNAAAGVGSLNGETGDLTVANSTTSGTTITIDDASTSAKGIASFSGTDFSIASGAVSLQGTVTKAGNSFNGASQLVQLNASGFLPALNASALTNIDADNIATGTLDDNRLSNNVARRDVNNTFTKANIFRNDADGISAFSIQNASGMDVLNVDTASQSINIGGAPVTYLQPSGTTTYAAAGSGAYYSCSGSDTLSGTDCIAISSYPATDNPSYTCPTAGHPWYLVSGTCYHYADAPYASGDCAMGRTKFYHPDLYNGGCADYTDTPTLVHNYSCPSGGTLSGSNCLTSSTYGATYNPPTYHCPSGGTLDGSNCVVVTSTTVSATTSITASSSSRSALTLQGAAGQSVDVLRIQGNDQSAFLSVAHNGNVGIGAVTDLEGSTHALNVQGGAAIAGAFTLTNAAGTDTLFTANITDNQIIIGNATGTGANTTTLVLDSATTDPDGVDGAMYYKSDTHEFRCYVNGTWGSCAGSAGSGVAIASGSGETDGRITKFVGGELADTNLSESGSTLTYAGNAVVNASSTTQTALQVNANSLTTGSGLKVSTTSNAVSGGNLLEVTQSSVYAGIFSSSNKLLNVNRDITGPMAPAPVTVDLVTTGQASKTQVGCNLTYSINHTVSGANRILLVSLSFNGSGQTPTAVTFTVGGVTQSLTKIAAWEPGATAQVWALVSPTLGTGTITASHAIPGCGTPGPGTGPSVVASSWNGVDTTNAYGTSAMSTWSTSQTSASVNVTTTPGQQVVDVIARWPGSGSVTPGAGQTLVGEYAAGGLSQSRELATSTSTTMSGSWSTGSSSGAIFAIPLNGLPVPGTVNGTLTGPAANISSSCLGCTEVSSILNLQQSNTLATGAVLSLQNSGLGADIQLSSGILRNATDSATALRIQNSAGTETLLTADASNNRIKIGDAAANTTTLVLDTASSDPGGVNGAMYYRTSDNVFRCYTNGTWGNCGAGGVTVAGSAGDTKLTKFNSSGQLTNTNLSETGTTDTTLTYVGNAVITAASGFSGNLLDVQLNGSARLSVSSAGNLLVAGTINDADISGGTLSAAAVNGLNASGTGISGDGTGNLTIGAGGTNRSLILQATGTGVVQISSTLSIQGSASIGQSLTIGTASVMGGLVLHAGNGFTGTVRMASGLGHNTVYVLPAVTGTIVEICTSAGNCIPNGNAAGDMLYWNGTSWAIIPAGNDGDRLEFCSGVPVWGGNASITTSVVTSVTSSSAVSGGTIAGACNGIVERGVVYATTTNPTTANYKVVSSASTNSFSSTMTGLNYLTTYYVRAYVTTAEGTVYGAQRSFTTLELGVGNTGPGGGIIFYDKGSYSSGWRYLEAATSDQGGAVAWCSNTTTVLGANGMTIGTGKTNTTTAAASCSSGAIRIAENYSGGGQTDWFLPSPDELLALYSQSMHFSDLPNTQRWTSWERDNDEACTIFNSSPSCNIHYKSTNIWYVRPIRQF